MATTPNYTINYDDERFTQVEADKQTAINDMNNTYNEMIGQTDQYYQDQINASNEWAEKQQDIQNQNTQFTIDTINQQKEQSEKDYKKEQSGAYVDWQKQSNQYGVNAENQATQGLNNTGYSESSQVSMYNQYQSRVALAREGFNKAIMNFDNNIKEAQLANNAKLAEIAYNAQKTQLELSLQGFQYKNQLLMDQINKKQELDNTYYNRYQNVLNQINTENSMAEQVRQYNESLAEEKRQFEQNYALQKEQFAEQKRQFEQDYVMKEKQYQEDIRQFNTQIAYYKEKDAQEYALKIKQLEEEKKQREIAQQQWEKEYSLKQQQMAQEQARWEKEYSLSKAKVNSEIEQQRQYIIDKDPKTTSSVRSNVIKQAENTLKMVYNGAIKMASGTGSKTAEITATNLQKDALEKLYSAGQINQAEFIQLAEKYGF